MDIPRFRMGLDRELPFRATSPKKKPGRKILTRISRVTH